MIHRLILLSPLLLVAACAGAPPLQSNAHLAVVSDATELPPPTSEGEGKRGYQIGPLDKLAVDVYGFDNISDREIQVDSAGRISIPMAGSLDVADLTPGEAERRIADALRQNHVRDPHVTVNVKESLNQFVTVDGQVGQPGNYPVVNEMTLMRAIAAARGTGEFAKLEDVVVFRTVGTQRMAALYNLGAIRRGYYPDPAIYPKDVVIVGDSPARRLFRDLISTAPLLTAPVLLLTR